MISALQIYRSVTRAGGLTLRVGATVLGLKAVATVFEGAGVAMLVPVFEAAGTAGKLSAPSEKTEIWRAVERCFAFLGVEMTFAALLVAVAILLALRQVTTYAHRVYVVASQQRMVQTLRNRIVDDSFAASVEYHDETPTGHVVNDIVTESQRAVAVAFAVYSTLGNLLVTGVYVAGLTLASGWLSVAAFVAAGCLGFSLRGLMRLTRDNSEWLASANRALSTLLVGRLRAVRLLKLTGSERKEAEAIAGAVENARASALMLAKLQARIPLIIEPAGAVMLMLLFYVGIEGMSLPFEVMLVIVLVLARLIPVVQEIAKGFQTFLAGVGSMRFVVQRLAGAQAAAEAWREVAGPALPILRQGIRFDHVAYRYPGPGARPALHDISLTVPAGRLTAIVGPSGAGKSTLIDLLPALRQPTEGKILFDGKPIDSFSRSTLRGAIAFVPQSPQLLAERVGDHIRYGRPDASDAAVIEAARLAGAHEFISGMAGGYAAPIGEDGTGLSGGQRQRLDLARALLQKRPILILDEPASNLDAESEEAFRQALSRIRQTTETTIILIAHRFASVVDADQIVVLVDGRVDAAGMHRDLLAGGGWYSRAFCAGETEWPGSCAPATFGAVGRA